MNMDLLFAVSSLVPVVGIPSIRTPYVGTTTDAFPPKTDCQRDRCCRSCSISDGVLAMIRMSPLGRVLAAPTVISRMARSWDSARVLSTIAVISVHLLFLRSLLLFSSRTLTVIARSDGGKIILAGAVYAIIWEAVAPQRRATSAYRRVPFVGGMFGGEAGDGGPRGRAVIVIDALICVTSC